MEPLIRARSGNLSSRNAFMKGSVDVDRAAGSLRPEEVPEGNVLWDSDGRNGRGATSLLDKYWIYMSFPANEELEQSFHVYRTQNNRGTSIRLHFMMVLGWFLGLLKTLMLASREYYKGDDLSGFGWLGLFFLLLLQIIAGMQQLYAVKAICSLNMMEQLEIGDVKARAHVLFHMIVVSVAVLSNNQVENSASFLSLLVFCTLLSIADTIPLRLLIPLSSIKIVTFVIVELLGSILGVFEPLSAPLFVTKLLQGTLIGVLIPLYLAAKLECTSRQCFLRHCDLDDSNLGPFWRAVRLMPGGRA